MKHLFNAILQRFGYQIAPYDPTAEKYAAEHRFRKEIIASYIQWYNGEIEALYGEPPPKETEKVRIGSLQDNAILTWIKIHQERKYLEDLLLEPSAFAGMRLLDIGAAAAPSALVFENCDVYCLDPLLPEFMKLGFPFWAYDKRARFVYGYAEHMPFPDSFFDAVISVNALDHVDDFAKTAAEIKRVLKPGGRLRFHLHYHPPTECEPLSLNDTVVRRAFAWCEGFRKIHESNRKRGEEVDLATERFTVWTNFD